MKFEKLLLMSTLFLCACGENITIPNKTSSLLICYSEDSSDPFLGSKIQEVSKKINAKKDNTVKIDTLPLGTNGNNYENVISSYLSNNKYDYVSIIGEKANIYLNEYVKGNQGIDFLLVDSRNENTYYHVTKYEFIPEEIGYISGKIMNNNGNVGYFSSYKTAFDNRQLFGFLKAQEDLGNKQNVVIKYLEESFNFEKTIAYTNQIFDVYSCAAVFENLGSNVNGILSAIEGKNNAVVSTGCDYSSTLDNSNLINNIIIKNYEKIVDTLCQDIMNNNLNQKNINYLSVKDDYLTLKKVDNVISEIKNNEIIIEQYQEDKFDELYEKVAKNIDADYTPKYSVAVPYHEGIPNCGDQQDWKYAPRYGADNGMKPESWTAVGAWATIYAQEGFSRAKNTGIEFKNMRIWGYSEETGWKLIEWANPIGSFYDEDFVNDYHQEFPNNVYNNSETKTTRIKLDNANIGFNYHPFSSQNDLKSLGLSNLKYIISTMDIRLVVWNTELPSDIDDAKYVANIGGDWWAYKGATWQPDWSTNRDICISQYRTITKNWKTMYMSNIPIDIYDEIVGNGDFLKEFE